MEIPSTTKKWQHVNFSSDTSVQDILDQPPESVRIVIVCHACGQLPERSRIPSGDILIYAGDLESNVVKDELCKFITWIEELPHKNKVLVAERRSVEDTKFNSAYYEKLNSSYKKQQWSSSPLNVDACTSTNSKELQLHRGHWTHSIMDISHPFVWQRDFDETDRYGNDLLTRLLDGYVYEENTPIEILGLTFSGTLWYSSEASRGSQKRSMDSGRSNLRLTDGSSALNVHDPNDRLIPKQLQDTVDVFISTTERRHSRKDMRYASYFDTKFTESRPRYCISWDSFGKHGCSSDGQTIFINLPLNASPLAELNKEPNKPIVVDMIPCTNASQKLQSLVRSIEGCTPESVRRSQLQAALLQSPSSQTSSNLPLLTRDPRHQLLESGNIDSFHRKVLHSSPRSNLRAASPPCKKLTSGSDTRHAMTQRSDANKTVFEDYDPISPEYDLATILANLDDAHASRPGLRKAASDRSMLDSNRRKEFPQNSLLRGTNKHSITNGKTRDSIFCRFDENDLLYRVDASHETDDDAGVLYSKQNIHLINYGQGIPKELRKCNAHRLRDGVASFLSHSLDYAGRRWSVTQIQNVLSLAPGIQACEVCLVQEKAVERTTVQRAPCFDPRLDLLRVSHGEIDRLSGNPGRVSFDGRIRFQIVRIEGNVVLPNLKIVVEAHVVTCESDSDCYSLKPIFNQKGFSLDLNAVTIDRAHAVGSNVSGSPRLIFKLCDYDSNLYLDPIGTAVLPLLDIFELGDAGILSIPVKPRCPTEDISLFLVIQIVFEMHIPISKTKQRLKYISEDDIIGSYHVQDQETNFPSRSRPPKFDANYEPIISTTTSNFKPI